MPCVRRKNDRPTLPHEDQLGRIVGSQPLAICEIFARCRNYDPLLADRARMNSNSQLIRWLIAANLLCCSILSARADELQIGVAQVEITPPPGFRKGGGYAEVISTGVRDPLFAKVLVLRQGVTSVALVISDLLSVPSELSGAAPDAQVS